LNFSGKNFSAKTLDLFGSFVREEQIEKSDLDVLVTFSEPKNVDLFKFIELRLFLKYELGVDADLLEKDTFTPRLKCQILEEVCQMHCKLSTTQILEVTVDVLGVWHPPQSFLSRISKDGRTAIPKLAIALFKDAKPNLDNYVAAVRHGPF
jgi:hypothetical protein